MAKRYKQRSDGRYEAKVNVGFDPQTGKAIRIGVYGKTIKELEQKKAQLLMDQRKGIDLTKRNLTFKNYAKIWYSSKKDMEKATYEVYDRILKLCESLNNYPITEITRIQIQGIIDANQEHPRTCQQIKNILNQIFKLAIVDRLIYFNPVDGVVLPKYTVNKKRALTEYEDILSDVTTFSDRETAYVYLIKYLGLRREETLALCSFDFNMNNKTVTVKRALTWVKNRPELKSTKTSAGVRTLTMPQTLFNFISYYLSNLTSDFLFTNITDGLLITETSFKRMWKSIISKMNAKADELGFPHCEGLTSHIFRHNFSTILSKINIPMDDRKYMLGHSSITVTIDTYTHIESTVESNDKLLEVYWSKRESESSKCRQTIIDV